MMTTETALVMPVLEYSTDEGDDGVYSNTDEEHDDGGEDDVEDGLDKHKASIP